MPRHSRRKHHKGGNEDGTLPSSPPVDIKPTLSSASLPTLPSSLVDIKPTLSSTSLPTLPSSPPSPPTPPAVSPSASLSLPSSQEGGMPTKIRICNKMYTLYVKMGGEFVTIKRAMAMEKAKAKKKK